MSWTSRCGRSTSSSRLLVFRLGLSAADQAAYYAALQTSHPIRVSVSILDRNEKHEGSLSFPMSQVLGGQVDVDGKAEVTRSVSLTALDPNRVLQFDSSKIADGAVYADSMLAVSYDVWVASIGRWVECPVFRGPLSRFDRNGAEITLEAMGKESLALAPHFSVNAYTIKAGTWRGNAIREIMGRKGEQRFRLQAPGKKLARSISLVPNSEPWRAITGGAGFGKGIHGGANHVFYDGDGYLVLRRLVDSPVWVLSDEWLLDEPKTSFDMSAVRNWIRVLGAPPKGARRAPQATVQLVPADPLSPQSLGRNGKPRYLAEFVEDEQVTSIREAVDVGERLLRQRRKQAVSVQVEALPLPFLEPGDVLRLDDGLSFELNQFTIPLVHSSSMSLGFTKRVSVARSKRKIKVRRNRVKVKK